MYNKVALFALLLLGAMACEHSLPTATVPVIPGPSEIPFVVFGVNVTCTNGSVNGNVGTWAVPGVVVLTECPVGEVHKGDVLAAMGANSFIAMDFAAGAAHCSAHLVGTLAGVTLAPGVYCLDATAKTGVLTLEPGNYVMRVTVGALTGTNFSIVPNGAKVTWWIDQGTTFTDSKIVGNVLAGGAITLTRTDHSGKLFSWDNITMSDSKVK